MANDRDALPAEIAALSFEEALAALEKIVDELERGAVSLEQSIGIYERGTQLKRHCEAKLNEAEARIELVTRSGALATGTQPFAGDAA